MEGETTGERPSTDEESEELLSGLSTLLPAPLLFLRFGMAIEDDMVPCGTELGRGAREDRGRGRLGTTADKGRSQIEAGRSFVLVRTGTMWSRKRRRKKKQSRDVRKDEVKSVWEARAVEVCELYVSGGRGSWGS